MPDHYVLHFPFKWLRESQHEDFVGVAVHEPEFEMRLVKTDVGDIEIIIQGLPNRPFAEQCVLRCWFALMCVSVLHHRPSEAELALAEPEFLDPESKEIMGRFIGVDYSDYESRVIGTVPYVRGSSERVKRHRMSLTLVPKREETNIGEELLKWMWHPGFFDLFNDKKLRLALALANLVAFDAPKQARFILIVSAIEALLPQNELSDDILSLISNWEQELKKRQSESTDEQFQQNVQLLLNKTSFLRVPSISTRLKEFAREYGPADAPSDYMKTIDRIYNLRSMLVHQGDCDEDELMRVYPVAHDLLHRALRRRLGVE